MQLVQPRTVHGLSVHRTLINTCMHKHYFNNFNNMRVLRDVRRVCGPSLHYVTAKLTKARGLQV